MKKIILGLLASLALVFGFGALPATAASPTSADLRFVLNYDEAGNIESSTIAIIDGQVGQRVAVVYNDESGNTFTEYFTLTAETTYVETVAIDPDNGVELTATLYKVNGSGGLGGKIDTLDVDWIYG
jgi:hypothetical protein